MTIAPRFPKMTALRSAVLLSGLFLVAAVAGCSSDGPSGLSCSKECPDHSTCAIIASASQCICDQGHEDDDCATCSPGYAKDPDGRCLRDLCYGAGCSAHGTCAVLSGAPACLCEEGYAGAQCLECATSYRPSSEGTCVTDACFGEACNEHGRCVAESTAAQCLCEPGYANAKCSGCAPGYQRDQAGACVVDPCYGLDCSIHGSCAVSGTTPASCSCETGYAGTHCERCGAGYRSDGADGCVLNSCVGVTCGSHGTCVDQGGAGKCLCAEGYAGNECGQCATGYRKDAAGACVTDLCFAIDCTDHGACAESGGQGVCTCGPGYAGSRCEQCASGYAISTDARTCVQDRCFGRTCGEGTCHAANGTCLCNTGYTLDAAGSCAACAVAYARQGDGTCRFDACYNETCRGHGTCSGGTCACTAGYEGAHCESCATGYSFDPSGTCIPAACVGYGSCGHGSCKVVGGTALCECATGYFGERCADCAVGYTLAADGRTCIEDKCFGVQCGLGTCQAPSGAAVCNCPEGYGGAACERCADGYKLDAGGKCIPLPTLDPTAQWPQFGYDNYNRFQSPYDSPADLALHTYPISTTSFAGLFDKNGLGMAWGGSPETVKFLTSAGAQQESFPSSGEYSAALTGGFGVAVRGGYLTLGADLKPCFRKIVRVYNPGTGVTTVTFSKEYCATQASSGGTGYSLRVTKDADAMVYVAPFGGAGSVVTGYRDSLSVAWTYDVSTATTGDAISTRLVVSDDKFLYLATKTGWVFKLDRKTGSVAWRIQPTGSGRSSNEVEVVAATLTADGYLLVLGKDGWYFRIRTADGTVVRFKDLGPYDPADPLRSFDSKALALGTGGFFAVACTPTSTNGKCVVTKRRADTGEAIWATPYVDVAGNTLQQQYWGPLTITKDGQVIVLANGKIVLLGGANGSKLLEQPSLQSIQPAMDVTGGMHFVSSSNAVIVGGTQKIACTAVPCSGHGSCQTQYGLAYCACDSNYLAQGLECVYVGP